MRAERGWMALIALITLAGCTRPADLARPGVLAHWEKEVLKREASRFAGRSIAEESGSRPACLKDRIALQWLKEQVAEEELKYAGTPVTGSWNGLDLSRFHRAGGTFLSQHGGVIHSGASVNFEGCVSIPCIYNRIYGKDDDAEQGWRAYFWFLRTGTALSAINRVHRQNSADNGVYGEISYELDKYLFKDDELEGFWKIAHTGGERYRSSAYFKRLHRVPHGANIENEGTACGLADPSGEILLSDSCVTIYSGALYRGFFYVGVPHEIAHQIDYVIDYTIGRAKWDKFSETAEFRELSGWFEDEYTDPEGNTRMRWALPWPEETYVDARGATKKRYVIPDAANRGGLDGFVRDYARVSPGEDFAESVAFARYRADVAKSEIPRKLALISEKIYGGRTFDDEGLTTSYREIGKHAIESELPRMVRDCVNPRAADSAEEESEAPAIDLGVTLPPSIRGCIERDFATLLDAAVAELKATELDACDFLSADKESALRAYWSDELKGRLAALVSDERRVASIVRATEDFRTELQAWVDPREAYLNCFRSRGDGGRPNVQECYERVLSEAFERVASGYAESIQEILEVERERYFAENTIEASQARTQELYAAMFGGVDVLLQSKANTRWRECLSAPGGTLDGGAVLLTAPFSGGTQYIAGHVLNCINSAAESDLDEVRDRFTGEKFQVGGQEARAFLRLVVLQPRFIDMLQERADRLAVEEQRRFEEALQLQTAELQSAMLTERTWIEGVTTSEQARERCDAEALLRIEGRLSSGGSPMRPIFSSISQVERSVAANACREVMRSVAVRRELENIPKRQWDEALTRLEVAVAGRADRQAKVCWTEYQRKTKTHRNGRRRCMTRHWERSTARGFGDWSATQEGQQLTSRHEEARAHLRMRKDVLLAAAIERMESMH